MLSVFNFSMLKGKTAILMGASSWESALRRQNFIASMSQSPRNLSDHPKGN